jgi:hypothetical protein
MRRSVLYGTARRNHSMTESRQVQDRASCLPESSRRALVADAREIRQYQMHPPSPLRSVTDTQSVALLSSPGPTLASVLRHPTPYNICAQFSASRSLRSRSAPGRHNRVQLSTVNGRPPSKVPEHTQVTCKPSFSRTCYLGPVACGAPCLADTVRQEHGL